MVPNMHVIIFLRGHEGYNVTGIEVLTLINVIQFSSAGTVGFM